MARYRVLKEAGNSFGDLKGTGPCLVDTLEEVIKVVHANGAGRYVVLRYEPDARIPESKGRR
jgi:hypothetical protein